jgi:hypothetical protein
MPVWLFPLGLLGGVVPVSLSTLSSFLLAMVWGFAVVPHGAAYIRRRARGPGAGSDESGFHDVDTDYWRTTPR